MNLYPLVEKVVREKLDACEPFTTVDISHPLIKHDPSIRHYEVRLIINQMDKRGDIEAADFETSMVRVFPDGQSTGIMVRLWHPAGYDVSQYANTRQALIRANNTSEARRIEDALKLADGNREKASKVLGIPLRTLYRKLKKYGLGYTLGSCRLQHKDAVLNVPARLIREAGWVSGDSVCVRRAVDHLGKWMVLIQKSQKPNASHCVDHEGRIRIHGEIAKLAVDSSGKAVARLATTPGGEKEIRFQ